MKKYSIVSLLAAVVLIFSYCGSSRKTASAPPKLAYENGVKTLIAGNCSPCHFPEKGGKKKAYDNYANVKSDIDEILRRIQLNPQERGFMPFKKTAKLSDSSITVFKQWKDEGLLEN